MRAGRSLVFVYNADSETLPRMNDHMIRIAIPGKDACALLAVTFTPIGMKKEWRRFLATLGLPVRFLSRDEFGSEFRNIRATFPAAYVQEGEVLFHFISTEEINQCRQLEDLVALVREKFELLGH